MYVVMIDMPNKIKDFFTLKYLSLGLTIYTGDSPKTVQKILDEKGPGILFVEISHLNSIWLPFLAKLRQYKPKEYFKLIILSDKSDRNFLQTLLLLNVTGLIPASISNEDVFIRLSEIIKRFNIKQNENREHQRVIPRKTDEITINLSIPNSSTILSGVVINISIGGVALQLKNTGEVKWLSSGLFVESAQVRLNGKIGMTGLKIVMVKNIVAGARFIRPTDYFLNLLGRYLLDRLSNG